MSSLNEIRDQSAAYTKRGTGIVALREPVPQNNVLFIMQLSLPAMQAVLSMFTHSK